jgi:cell division protein FtsB
MEDRISKLEKEVKRYRTLSIVAVIVSVVLLFITIFFISKSHEQVTQVAVFEEQNAELQNELDSILREYEAMKSEYGDLNAKLSEKDSVILANAQEIQKLITSQADYRRIKKKLELLQDQGKEYVNLLDSLYKENKKLTEENTEIKQRVSHLSKEKEILTQEKEVLEEKVTIASKLKAYNVSLRGMAVKSGGKKEDETDKSKKVKKLKVTFTLSENELIPAGELNLYCRISLPDGRVLALGKGEGYSFTNDGKLLQYSIKTSVNYEKTAKKVTMEWDLRNEDKAVSGEYTAQIFTETDYIGEGKMILQ